MGQKRITPAEAQREMTRIESELQHCDSYAGDVRGRVRAELGSMSIPPQQEGDTLENEERMNQHYKKVSDILTIKAKVDAKKFISEEDDLKIADRVLQTRKVELERLKLLKIDAELDERQRQVLSDIKARLLEYPALLQEVTGDKTFLEGIKTNYQSQLEGYETKLDRLIDDVYSLRMTFSDNVETSLAAFAERTLKPAINIVKLQHERLETELSETDERSEQLERRIEELKAEVEDVGAEKRRLEEEYKAREEGLAKEIAVLKKELEDERRVIQDQNEKHKRKTSDLESQIEKARTTAAEQVKGFEEELQSYSRMVKNLETDKEGLRDAVNLWRERVNTRRQQQDDLQAEYKATEVQLRSAQDQVFSLEEDLRVVKKTADEEKESLQIELTAVKEARNSAEIQIQSMKSQLLTARNENASLKESSENDIRSFQSQLSAANTANESLVKSKQELEIGYGRATEVSQLTSRLLQWHISIFDNMEGFESEDAFREMGAIVETMEQYAGSTTEVVSMPKYRPGMTLLAKAMDLPEPNLAAARQLWISSRCGSLDLNVAQAFFMQQAIPSAQFALLPWIHASLNCAVTTMCERSTLTPDLAKSLLRILGGFVYTATVAREWSEDQAWIPKVMEMLVKIKEWIGEHVPNDEASFLMMVADQVNDVVITHKSPSMSITSNLFAEVQRIDSANSDIPDGTAMVMDNSGMIILFTADNAFVFGASEVKVVEFDNSFNVVFIFDPQVSGLPEDLREIRLHDRGRPEAVNAHQELIKSVLPKERLARVSMRKYLRKR